jgi:ubiquitin C-terminal hydrolase
MTRFVLDSSTTCKSCGYVSSTVGDIEGTLAIDIKPRIPGGGDLGAYVQQYLTYKVCGYKCDHCKDATTDKQRSRKLAHSPDIVTVQLKRFNWAGQKDSHPVPINTLLNLNANRTSNNKSNSGYELSAVVLHQGSLNGGHYISMAKGADGQWLEFDDNHVSRVSGGEMAALTDKGKAGGFTPYLCFYQRVRK